MRVLFLMLLALAPCALAQRGQNQPAVNIPNQPLNLPARNAPAIDQPGSALPGTEGPEVGQLNLRTMPIEDAVVLMFMLMAADAQEDIEDLLEEMADSREERHALRRKYRQARHEAREHDRERREHRRAQWGQMRDEAREKREEQREALREAREKSREEARDRREQLREQRAALREEQREARRKKREAMHIYYEARARQSLLAASLVTSVVDQFNVPEGPQPRRVGILLDQIDAQAVKLKDPPPETKPDEKARRNDELVAAHLGELRGVWREFVAATTAGPTTAAKVAPWAVPQMPARLSAADEARLKAMIAQHHRVRSQLPTEHQAGLDQLTAQMKMHLFAEPLRGDLLASAAQIVSRMIPGLTTPEAASLAEYALGGIADGGVIGAAAEGSTQAGLMNAMSPMQETQMSFNLQYLQLQSQMQHESRSYTAISNIMKTKHDTVKNSISNIR